MYQQLKTQFLEIITPFLAGYGFNFEKSLSSHKVKFYSHIKENNTNRIRFEMRESVDLYIDINAIIINEEVGQIRKKFKEGVDLGNNYFTVAASISKIIPPTHILYRLKPYCISADVRFPLSKTVSEIEQLFIEVIFPFFDQYQTIPDLDKWFNQPILDGTYDFFRSATWNDSIQGLIVAKLNHNPQYERLYQLWLKNIHPDKKQEIDMIKAVKIFLDGLKV
ncbi:hypothetical protein [Xanthocytophaga agilis]|uniref:Uncharacterized protein n=1 Tax=Xanthocytophaga agilis TaxID=3048010 RepID=A0AAE3R3Z6_9BACT|nr:hypothetical protein [Xanthocytophaga agilis]MDJ1501162.1 hypothetical protein [Xanthocytophaga agilis]